MKEISKDNIAGTIVILLLLIPQMAHTLYVFEVNSRYDHPWFAYCYAIGIDTAILIFTRKGWLRTALAYFFATLAHNIVYLYYPESVWSGLLIGVSLSATIYALTHLFLQNKPAVSKGDISATPIPDQVWQIYRSIEAGVHFEAQPFVCPECGESFASKKKLNGHISSHKKQKQWNEDQYGDWQLENHKRYQKV